MKIGSKLFSINYRTTMSRHLSFLLIIISSFLSMQASCKDDEHPDKNNGSSPGTKKELSFTPFIELNQGASTLNSHEGACERSSIKMMYSSYMELNTNAGVKWPYYSRIRKINDNLYMMFWQSGLHAGDGNGHDTHYATSADLKNWNYKGYLWQGHEVINCRNQKDKRYYTNANALVLKNGDILAVSSFRAIATYNFIACKSDQGIVIKRSSDNGATWHDEKVIYHGPNWEAHLMELPSGELQCYFSESRPWIGGSHSGTSLVFSKDGGKTWSPSLGSENYRVMRRSWYSEDNKAYYYTNQMPVGIILNGTSQFAFSMEDVTARVNGKQSYFVSIVYSPENGEWKNLTGEEIGPSIRQNDIVSGTAAYLVQFKSGETVLGYAGMDEKFYTMVGDEKARNFSGNTMAWPYRGGWPGMEIDTDHTLLGCMRNHNVSYADATIALARFALNHDIKATSRKVVLDADNKEWSNTDDALYLGEISQAEATIRCSQDADNVYFLIEVRDDNLSISDYVSLMIAPDIEGGKLNNDAMRIKLNINGVKSTDRYYGGWFAKEIKVETSSAYDGTIGDKSDKDYGYMIEVAIPRTELNIIGGKLKFNAALYDAAATAEDALSTTTVAETSKWKYIEGL